MRRYDSNLKFQVYRLLRRQSYANYKSRIREFGATEPSVLSHQYLERLLCFARVHNPYYRRILDKCGEFKNVPILTKDIIRTNMAVLQSNRVTAKRYENSSGGSTGVPVTLIQDNNYRSWSNATQAYYFQEFLSVAMNGVRSAWLWGAERDTKILASWRGRVGLFLQNRLLLNTFDTSEQRWLDFIQRIRDYRPYYVAGYAGSLYQMARVARKFNVRLYAPTFVYSSAEMLQDFMRREIEEQFNARVFDYYGSREVGPIAGECPAGRRHVFIMNNVVEILDDAGQGVDKATEGRIIVTNLHNYSLPMIRYEIGDSGRLALGSCDCGSSLPVLESLTGRVTDHFRLRNGGLVHGEYFTHLFYFRDWVEQFQIDQMAYDRICISVIPAGTVTEGDVGEINSKIRLVMGEDCDIEWRYAQSIEKSPQGKHRFTRCFVD